MSLDPITAGLDLLGTLARIVEQAQAGQTTPAGAIAAARKALGVDPFAGMAAEDAARRARLVAHAQVLRSELAAGMMLPGPVHAAVVALADHVEHQARVERSDEITAVQPLPGPRKP